MNKKAPFGPLAQDVIDGVRRERQRNLLHKMTYEEKVEEERMLNYFLAEDGSANGCRSHSAGVLLPVARVPPPHTVTPSLIFPQHPHERVRCHRRSRSHSPHSTNERLHPHRLAHRNERRKACQSEGIMSSSNATSSKRGGGDDEASDKKRQKKASADATRHTTPPMKELGEILQTWSPEETRIVRAEENTKNIRVGPLRGGDYVLNEDGDSATLSCCFKRDQFTYGVTVGYLVKRVGDAVYAFVSGEPLSTEDEDDSPIYETRVIGSVVSISQETDSLVFLLNGDVDALPMELPPESGLNGKLKFPEPNPSPPTPPLGTVLVGFAAQRRGAAGRVNTPALERAGRFSFVNDIGIVATDTANGRSAQLTDGGDCGALFLDLEGTPLYFHHVIRRLSASDSYESFGVPFARVMSCHSELGGDSHSESLQHKSDSAPCSSDWEESAPLQHFRVKIVEQQQAFIEYAGLGSRVKMNVTKH